MVLSFVVRGTGTMGPMPKYSSYESDQDSKPNQRDTYEASSLDRRLHTKLYVRRSSFRGNHVARSR